MSLHPSEEHALVAETTVRRVYTAQGRAVGQVPLVLPGSLDEREMLAHIDAARWEATRPPKTPSETRRRLRRYWREQPR